MAVKSAINAISYTSDNDVSAPLGDFVLFEEANDLASVLHGGTKAMRAAREKYLPMEESESLKAYAARLKRSVLANYYKRTLEKLTGQAFENEIEISEQVPEPVQSLFEDIDRDNNNLNVFMSEVFYSAIHHGVAHVMVEYPNVQGAVTVEQHKKAKARPYWVFIDPMNVIGWRTKQVAGATVLTQLRVKETVSIESGKYGIETEERVRVYEPGKWEVWRNGETGWCLADDENGVPLAGTTSLDFIPLSTLMLGEKMTAMTARPCLDDLAELNCVHWQSSSDQRNILHYARLITYFGKQLDVDKAGGVVFAANSLVHATSANADLKIVEHSGAGIEAGRNDLKDLELAMSIFGLTLLMPKVQGTTATENTLDKNESDSALVSWVKKMGSMLETLLAHTCHWMNIEPAGALLPFTDFNMGIRAADTSLLLEAYKAKLLPAEAVIIELKARGVITQDIDMLEIERMFEDEEKRSTNAMPANGMFQGQPMFNPAQQGEAGEGQAVKPKPPFQPPA